ncbi:arginine--tRNA ligase [Lichenifustis flavocetrariae]|uniref:Arginine--tRNA ligase n=1 Tax=Lichenifustis flavocetrariae TaxID=2949735 RepID=A0AA41Z0S0_9HYPH|nr:arginine--tRNA ligase [Lichenifustis flavocetrariae]MCW6510822.1 arginine--tRNA ligase [Lichenifustis flavocetrariae]
MDIFADFRRRIIAILESMMADGRLPETLDLGRFVVEPPRDSTNGDLATNAAMVYAREAQAHYKSPRQFATALAAVLAEDPDVDTAEVAGPGFLNLRLQPNVLGAVLRESLADAERFGRGRPAGDPRPINVEFVSANPTGPMHVGHGRGAVFGDALANLLSFAGHDVTREYYINDAGAQVDVLARSAFLRYREALGHNIGAIPEGLYPGDYLKSVGDALACQHGDSLLAMEEAAWLPRVRQDAIDAMMGMIRDDLASLNIRHEVFFSERSLTVPQPGHNANAVEEAIEDLDRKGLIYQGRLPPPKGQLPDDWEDREQTLFRSTDFGDDVDRALRKSDGSYTYFASDIAYHKTKVDRGFGVLIDVLGADHGGYVKRMVAAVAALSDRKVGLDVKLCQMVKLLRGGEPVKMSKRSGDFVTLREVVDEVGVDAVRFMMLFRKNDAPLDFDLDKVIEQSKDNPVFYVQYAHARGRSVLRQAVAAFPDLDVSAKALATAKLDALTDQGEVELIRMIAQFPRIVESAATAHEPHRIAFYLHELASALHTHWNRGKDHPELRFVKEDQRDLSCARLALVGSLTIVLKAGLGILGVSAPDEMR